MTITDDRAGLLKGGGPAEEATPPRKQTQTAALPSSPHTAPATGPIDRAADAADCPCGRGDTTWIWLTGAHEHERTPSERRSARKQTWRPAQPAFAAEPHRGGGGGTLSSRPRGFIFWLPGRASCVCDRRAGGTSPRLRPLDISLPPPNTLSPPPVATSPPLAPPSASNSSPLPEPLCTLRPSLSGSRSPPGLPAAIRAVRDHLSAALDPPLTAAGARAAVSSPMLRSGKRHCSLHAWPALSPCGITQIDQPAPLPRPT